jgi:adenylate cyclase class IV
MEEREIKILEIEKQKIINKLNDLGARKVYDGEILTVHYDVCDRTFRIRRLSDRIKLGCKQIIPDKDFFIINISCTQII